MTSHGFRFDQQFLQSRMRAALEPRTPRNGLLRFLMRAAGLAVLVMLVILGALVGVAMLAIGVVFRLIRGRGRPVAPLVGRASPDPRVVEGEFRVVDQTSLPR